MTNLPDEKGNAMTDETSGAEPAERKPMQVTEEMVSRFLCWELPGDFAPDAGITFKRVYNERSPFGPSIHKPTGTNLFTAPQARAMLEHVLAASPDRAQPETREVDEVHMRRLHERGAVAWSDRAQPPALSMSMFASREDYEKARDAFLDELEGAQPPVQPAPIPSDFK